MVNLMLWGEFQSYWTQTGTYESILPLINMDFDGLKTAIIQMISGTSVEVMVDSFQNDMVTFEDKDYVFLPKPKYMGELPALLVELKWNKTAKTALQQIKDKNYVQAISSYTGDILLVGINYDKKSKKHECVIEKYVVEKMI